MQRKNIMLGTAGHVDHGKTALVKLLTGCDTDRLPEEKRRGVTIELGFAPCQMRDERIVGVVDVPGHIDFIRNMVAGAHGIDVVIFVIAADDGVMPQTREHLDILTLLGVRHGLVALTKIDLIDAAMRQMVIEEVRGFVASTFLRDAPICPISNITGEGFEDFFTALDAVVERCEGHDAGGLFRLWIERQFHALGFGAVISGIPASGQVRVGQKLRLLPGGQVGRVRGLQVYGQDSPLAQAGECVAVNISDIEPEKLVRGAVLAEGEAFADSGMVEAYLRLLDHVPKPLKEYAEVHLHVGTTDCMAMVAPLEDQPLAPGRDHLVQLRLARPLPLAAGDRYVIRGSIAGLAGGAVTTLGGGRILSASGAKQRRNRPEVNEALRQRAACLDKPLEWLDLHLRGLAEPVSAAELARLAQLRPEMAAELTGQLVAAGKAIARPGGAVLHAAVLERAEKRLLECLEQFYQSNAQRLGQEEDALLAAAALPKPTAAAAMERLLAEKKLVRAGAILSLPGRTAKVNTAEEQLCARIEAALRDAGLAAPSPAELAVTLGVNEARLAAMLRLLADQGAVVKLDEKLTMHRSAVDRAQQVALDLFSRSSGFETVEFRDALGVSRKYAVPLLDYFDTIRLTARSGSRRTPGVLGKKLLGR